jgi:phytol kinase
MLPLTACPNVLAGTIPLPVQILQSLLAPPLLGAIVGITIWLGLVLAIAEVLSRQSSVPAELPRKIVHIGSGNVILLAWWWHIPALIGIAASVLFSGLTLLSYRYPIFKSVSGIGRRSWGTFFYAVSMGLLIGIFWLQGRPEFAVIGMLIMTWADGLAALIGQTYGRHPYQVLQMTKSWEGTTTMFIVSSLVVGLTLWSMGGAMAVVPIAIAVGTVATLLESFSQYGIDNLTVPLGSSILCFVLVHWFPI